MVKRLAGTFDSINEGFRKINQRGDAAMYIPPVKPLRTADPVSRARTAYTNTSYPKAPIRTSPTRDKFSLSDEARLREEYSLRLSQEGFRKRKRKGASLPSLPTLPDMARLYETLYNEICQTFRQRAGDMIAHAQTLDYAWRDTLENLAHVVAERLAHREGDPRAANIPMLTDIIGEAHRKFADIFCAALPTSGANHAISVALREAIKVLTLVQNYDLSLSDTMALLYYRRGLEKQR
ncbi:MAG: hypothetical protein FWE59_00055 [Oscillospiraceae bacterium]|nr:hypothetical protein [Oscillospiraceae bacterium]